MSNLVVVTGITGVQGGSVAEAYLAAGDWKVRGVTRDPESAKSKAWAARGVEIVRGELNDAASLAAAFEGAAVVFGVTDFWTIFGDAKSRRLDATQDITKYAYEVEIQQGKNLADAAAKVRALQRFVLSSMANATLWSKGKFSELYHMDSKAIAVDYAKGLQQLQGKFSQVQAPIYYNLLWQWDLPTTPRKAPEGTYNIRGIGPADVGIPFGDVAGDFGKVVKATAEAKPGLNVFALGQKISWDEYLDTWTKSQGVARGKAVDMTLEQMMEVLPGGLGREFGQNVLFAMEFGYEGGEPGILLPKDLGIEMKSFRDFCAETDFSAIL